MSANDVERDMKSVHKMMGSSGSYYYSNIQGKKIINPGVLSIVNSLQVSYGKYVGSAKARHLDYIGEINKIDNEVKKYFELLTQSSDVDYCFKLLNL